MNAEDEDPINPVNPNYLDHVVAAAATQQLEVTEDIVSGSGVKLLAKGARVDAQTRERLLQHKLSKPLEYCLGVVDGVNSQRIGELAQSLLERHGLIRTLCSHESAQSAAQSLAKLPLAPPVLSMLTVYAQRGPDRLAHAVAVALTALGLARRLMPGDFEGHQMLVRAGLLHDVGELYLQPDYLRRDRPLQAEQWRHIVSHPVIGHRVLREMDGAGPQVAELVLSHHERLDGFGYPRGLRGDQLSLPAQILAAAEWLVGLIESGSSPTTHASVATKLIPGEFCEALLAAFRDAARAGVEAVPRLDEPLNLSDALPRAVRVAEVLQNFRRSRALIDQHMNGASPALRAMLALCLQRMLQLQSSFTSAGLDTDSPQRLVAQLVAEEGAVQVEVMSLVREFSWRMRELEREALMRATLMSADDQALVQGLIDMLKGELQKSPAD